MDASLPRQSGRAPLIVHGTGVEALNQHERVGFQPQHRLAEEANDAREVLHMRVLPDAQVGRTDAASGRPRGFREHGACPQRRERTGGRDASRWQSRLRWSTRTSENRDAVTKMNIANLECVEQIHGLWMISGGDAVQSTSSIGNSPTFWKESS